MSVHAAVCVWGSCRVLVSEAREAEAKRMRLASMAATGAKGSKTGREDQARNAGGKSRGEIGGGILY